MTEVTVKNGLLTSINLHVEDSGGTGRPVVLIHGWPLSGESWSEQTGPLAEAGYRVVTYDRRGFGSSDKPKGLGTSGYDYDTLAEDLHGVLTELDLNDVTLVGFSMGGGEVARYATKYDNERVHSVVFAGAVPPFMAKSDDNPDGPLDAETAEIFEAGVKNSRETFFDQFATQFFSANGVLVVTEDQRQQALALEAQADHRAELGCLNAFGTTDFRDDLKNISVPTLVIHGDSDGVVPFEGSGQRTHAAIAGSELVVVEGGPHGFNVSHAGEFNESLIAFLAK
ncbi:alpha/beta fold hydrolase [Microlunatus antarcticus]|uniref:Pimeloyl-ACP methyl ester carboxylesterase n=1 Tax=Microlunatus antarcticus TaxID=53388 RepID=A0A7W5JY99_9ACTN|nr:alpha/beta hydrolase [Microlunatus antarcticus]MBB3328458.1 pimeloyl-ACP methyl ester carboxylesterase [Microlunatus antarcticus]